MSSVGLRGLDNLNDGQSSEQENGGRNGNRLYKAFSVELTYLEEGLRVGHFSLIPQGSTLAPSLHLRRLRA